MSTHLKSEKPYRQDSCITDQIRSDIRCPDLGRIIPVWFTRAVWAFPAKIAEIIDKEMPKLTWVFPL